MRGVHSSNGDIINHDILPENTPGPAIANGKTCKRHVLFLDDFQMVNPLRTLAICVPDKFYFFNFSIGELDLRTNR